MTQSGACLEGFWLYREALLRSCPYPGDDSQSPVSTITNKLAKIKMQWRTGFHHSLRMVTASGRAVGDTSSPTCHELWNALKQTSLHRWLNCPALICFPSASTPLPDALFYTQVSSLSSISPSYLCPPLGPFPLGILLNHSLGSSSLTTPGVSERKTPGAQPLPQLTSAFGSPSYASPRTEQWPDSPVGSLLPWHN